MPILLVVALLFCGVAFSQGTDAVLSGTVLDPTRAAVEGATVTATNTRTGVITRAVSNNSGVYLFPALQPGSYRIVAEHAGFKKYVLNDVPLELGDKVQINLPLDLGAVADSVEVRSDGESSLAYSTASIGGVITGQKVLELPLPSRDALGLVQTQAGLVGTNFAGSQRVALNITLDGINIQDNRINVGLNSTLFTSVDRIEEVRVVTSPADAELGRGSGQILLSSRAGTNQFHGSVFEYNRNTAMTANTWFNNQRGTDPVTGQQVSARDILIRNQFGARIGGPIKRNKTFFHFLYESQRIRTKSAVTRTVFTQTARQGVFRYFPGVQNANANANVPTVDLQGAPRRPATATGDLQSVSVFNRDPSRPGMDSSGIVSKALSLMPLPNNFRTGDGLNTAGYTWSLPEADDLSQYDFRIDHNFTSAHRATVTYNHENEDDINSFVVSPFPGLQGGDTIARTRVLSVAVLSTLSPSLLNEFRGGFQRPLLRFSAPWEVYGTSYLPAIGGQNVLPVFQLATTPWAQDNDPQGRISPVYQYADTVSWLKRKHAFRGGAEVRFVSTNGFNSFTVMPRATTGSGGVAVQDIASIPGIGQNQGAAENLLNDLSGSLANLQQAFNSPGGANPSFLAGEGKRRTWKTREFDWFFKDDWKVTKDLTLNLGVRYEYYGVPFDATGKAAGVAGGSAGLFGVSGTDFSALFRSGLANGSLTRVQLVGANSPNAGLGLYNPDRNNFAPAVGLAWSLPRIQRLGDRRMVLRAGYGWSYERLSLRIVDVVSGDEPGLRELRTLTSASLMTLAGARLPLSPLAKPLDAVPFDDRTQTVRAFDTGLRAPIVQNWNLSLQREMARGLTLEARYVGSKGSRLHRGADLNESNIFETGILDAYLVTQTGGNAPLFDTLFRGFTVAGAGPWTA